LIREHRGLVFRGKFFNNVNEMQELLLK